MRDRALQLGVMQHTRSEQQERILPPNRGATQMPSAPESDLLTLFLTLTMQKLFQATHWDLIDERPSLEGAYGGAYGTSAGGAPPPGVDGVDGSIVQSAAEAQAEAAGTAAGVHTYVRPPGAIHVSAGNQLVLSENTVLHRPYTPYQEHLLPQTADPRVSCM